MAETSFDAVAGSLNSNLARPSTSKCPIVAGSAGDYCILAGAPIEATGGTITAIGSLGGYSATQNITVLGGTGSIKYFDGSQYQHGVAHIRKFASYAQVNWTY